MADRWLFGPRIRVGLRVSCAALAVLLTAVGCVTRVDDGHEDVEQLGTGESSESSSSGELDALPTCAELPTVADLPHALAWHELAPDGESVVRVYVESEPIDCSRRDSAVTDGTRIHMTIPTTVDLPTRFELGAVDTMALMSPGGPGNDGSIFTIAWLTGSVELEALDATHVVGELHDAYGPFSGCFAAPICPD